MIIFLEGEQGKGYFVKGQNQIVNPVRRRQGKILHFAAKGCFAECFFDRAYPATAETLEDSEIGDPLSRYGELLRINSEITLKILKVMTGGCDRTASCPGLAFMMHTAGWPALSSVGRRIRDCRKDGCIINISLNQQDLANFIILPGDGGQDFRD